MLVFAAQIIKYMVITKDFAGLPKQEFEALTPSRNLNAIFDVGLKQENDDDTDLPFKFADRGCSSRPLYIKPLPPGIPSLRAEPILLEHCVHTVIMIKAPQNPLPTHSSALHFGQVCLSHSVIASSGLWHFHSLLNPF